MVYQVNIFYLRKTKIPINTSLCQIFLPPVIQPITIQS